MVSLHCNYAAAMRPAHRLLPHVPWWSIHFHKRSGCSQANSLATQPHSFFFLLSDSTSFFFSTPLVFLSKLIFNLYFDRLTAFPSSLSTIHYPLPPFSIRLLLSILILVLHEEVLAAACVLRIIWLAGTSRIFFLLITMTMPCMIGEAETDR
ncbi:uncharacterized protein EI90DRAFT_922424 [Cantharellus anzutake]|uniref:uncharacterized protein n=1 Tax=Cantharellus anzutake TaxID=1750568 RepID=UPI0019039DBB|nr:uncharacterized protein EI90DRAFT_922424 [Cantharellus anzutake]KAF8332081.1 hypothetical protein EI90DRAFT_922424 [Cantharellus anzutake]